MQLRLPAFTAERLIEVGRKVRDLYADGSPTTDRILALADDPYVADLASAVAGDLGGRAGVATRLFLKKLVGDVVDPIDQHPDFDPRRHYRLTIAEEELSRFERSARGAASVVDIELDP